MPGEKGVAFNSAGRPKGSKNKFTNLKDSYLETFAALGGTEGLTEWAMENRLNRRLFYQMVTKMLPSNVNLDSTDGLQIKIGSAFQPKGKDDKDSNTSDGS